MISGARKAHASRLRRLISGAMAHELTALVVPGPDLARARGLDLAAAGLVTSDTPRHADVLVVVGELPEALQRAAAVAYAQMPRPRAVMAVGAREMSPLPGPDVLVEMGQEELKRGVSELRRLFADGAFGAEVADFDVDAIRTQTEYVCPMHPEVVRNEPGTCPICGMDLVSREASGGSDDSATAHAGHGKPHDEMHRGGAHDIGHADGGEGRNGGREATDHGGHDHAAHASAGDESADGGDVEARSHGHEGPEHNPHGEHEEQDEHPGMEHHEHAGHGHTDHGDMGFMSMVEMTKDLPPSSDGLRMEWVEVPFGPLFPGLPAGLSLTLTLDGDTVAHAETKEGIEGRTALEELSGPADSFPERLARLAPLSPVAYRLLALRALEDAAGVVPGERTALARLGALERERAASHLGWLASFGHLLGYGWLERRAAKLQLALLRAVDVEEIGHLGAEVGRLARRVNRAPLLGRRLKGIAALPGDAKASGPVARASGAAADVRLEEEAYRDLGFHPVVFGGDDALSRLRVRLAETEQSLELVQRSGAIYALDLSADTGFSGTASARMETPRGAATLRATLEDGVVSAVELDTPSTDHLGLITSVAEHRELGDALVGVASLDISPWEVLR